MQAVILAAGMGNRLRPLSEKVPKALIEVNGQPILFNTLDILKKQGVNKVYIVIGYLGEEIIHRVGVEWKGVPIQYIHNTDYEKTNNIYSLWLAKDVLNEDTILLECDVYFEEKLIEKLISHRQENKVVVDVFKPGMDGTVVEIDDAGEIRKLITSDDQDVNFDYSNKYKTVNIYLFTKDFLQNYFLPNLDLYIKTQNKNKYYELILSIFVNLHNPVLHATIVDEIKWLEIDDFSDLKRAEILFADPLSRLKKAESAHGGYWRYDFLDFSYLYNLYFPPVPLLNDLRVNVSQLLTNYPSCQRDIANSLSNWVGVPSEYLTVANGVSEIIRILNTCIVKRMAIPIPTFNEYEAGLNSEQVCYFNTKDNDFILDLEKYAEVIIKEKCNVALIINPNNPTGIFNTSDQLKTFLDKLRELDLIIIDESFVNFIAGEDQSILREFAEFKNLVVLHSLGKELGILGVRLGYALSVNQRFNEQLRKALPIWNVNSFAEYILEILPKYRKQYRLSLGKVQEDREYLLKRMKEIPYVRILNTGANFVFAILSDGFDSEQLRDRLFMDFNILIKDCSNKKGLEDKKYIRIAVRTQSDTDFLIDSLKKVKV